MPASRVRSTSQLIRATNVPLVSAATARARLPLTVSAVGAGEPVTPAWVRLPCQVPRQEESNWCWCATTVGVQKFYVPTDTTTQCEAANAILSRTDACKNPGDPQVNQFYYLDKALATFSRLSGSIVAGALSSPQVGQEMGANKPLGARIGWANNEGGHFMAIVGFLDAPVPRVAISDPIYGESDLDYNLYCTAYQGNGTWTHSYRTQ